MILFKTMGCEVKIIARIGLVIGLGFVILLLIKISINQNKNIKIRFCCDDKICADLKDTISAAEINPIWDDKKRYEVVKVLKFTCEDEYEVNSGYEIKGIFFDDVTKIS